MVQFGDVRAAGDVQMFNVGLKRESNAAADRILIHSASSNTWVSDIIGRVRVVAKPPFIRFAPVRIKDEVGFSIFSRAAPDLAAHSP